MGEMQTQHLGRVAREINQNQDRRAGQRQGGNIWGQAPNPGPGAYANPGHMPDPYAYHNPGAQPRANPGYGYGGPGIRLGGRDDYVNVPRNEENGVEEID